MIVWVALCRDVVDLNTSSLSLWHLRLFYRLVIFINLEYVVQELFDLPICISRCLKAITDARQTILCLQSHMGKMAGNCSVFGFRVFQFWKFKVSLNPKLVFAGILVSVNMEVGLLDAAQ